MSRNEIKNGEFSDISERHGFPVENILTFQTKLFSFVLSSINY